VGIILSTPYELLIGIKDIVDLFGILFNTIGKDKVYYIDEEIEDPSVARMIEAFSIKLLKEGVIQAFISKKKSLEPI
jgi:hypothetical protein